MKVTIDKSVWASLREFYLNAMQNHPSLTKQNVKNKIAQLIKELRKLEYCALALNSEPYKTEWQRLGYRTYHSKGFIFGYKIYHVDDGKTEVVVYDVVHQDLNYNPEDSSEE